MTKNSPKIKLIHLAVLLPELPLSSRLIRAARHLFLDREGFKACYQVANDDLVDAQEYSESEINLLSHLDYQIILNICKALAYNFERYDIEAMNFYNLVEQEIIEIEHLELIAIAKNDRSFRDDAGIDRDEEYEDLLTAYYAEAHLTQAAKICTAAHELNQLSKLITVPNQGESL